jgi:hypothetical protein
MSWVRWRNVCHMVRMVDHSEAKTADRVPCHDDNEDGEDDSTPEEEVADIHDTNADSNPCVVEDRHNQVDRGDDDASEMVQDAPLGMAYSAARDNAHHRRDSVPWAFRRDRSNDRPGVPEALVEPEDHFSLSPLRPRYQVYASFRSCLLRNTRLWLAWFK